MLEEGELDQNGKFFNEKPGEGNGVLGDKNFAISERAGSSPRYEETREVRLLG